MTLTDEQIRQMFEARFPIPEGMKYSDEYNAYFLPDKAHTSTVYSFERTVAYQAKWEGFKAALSLQGEAVPVAIPSAPKKIWLNIGDTDPEEVEREGWKWNDLSDVTWSEHKVDQCDIPYIRADLAFTSPPITTDQQSELIQKCAEARRELQKIIEGYYPSAPSKTEQCKHGQYGYEHCETCIIDAIEPILALLPEEGKG